ncbi:MAG: immunoglobulin domain-containing protein, partial [Phycisphaerales bacterium]|nr:immunoglobulin domain-containing protein [Phycisphaerales bacterium]
ITGRFSRSATPTVFFQVAKLNAAGTDLIPLPSLSTSGAANGAIAFNGSLYAYGAFSGAPLPAGSANIVKLSADGAAWLPSTTDPSNASIAALNNGVNAALVYNDELIVGNSAATTPLAILSSSNGQWTFPSITGPISGGNSINILCPTPDGTQIAIGGGGDFGQFANTSATRLAFWNRSTNTYAPPARGFGDIGFGYPLVYAAAEFAGNLYMAGDFRGIGESKGGTLARWNGSTLAPIPGSPATSGVQWLFGDDAGGALYLSGGSFPLNRFDGITFGTVTDSNPAGYTTGVNGVSSAANYNGDLVVGGSFQRSGYINNLMRRSGTTWARFGAADPNGGVTALATWSTPSIAGGAPLLVASGQFTSIGALTARVAAWDGATWRALGQSSFAGYAANGAVNLLVLNGDLYQLAYMNGLNNSNAYPVLIRYNPASDTWNEIPRPPAGIAAGFGTPARGVVLNGAIWIASTYTLPGTSDPIGVLRWDGLAWSAYGGIAGGFPQSYGITAYDGDVVLVGGFASVGTQPQAGGGTTRGRFSNGWARLSTGGTPPVVAAQPLPAAACQGTSVSFTVTGNGQPPLGYRWQRVDADGIGTDLTDGPIPGIPATGSNSGTSTFTLSAVGTGADRLRLRCIVSNDCGNAASIPVRLFVAPADIGAAGGVAGRDALYDNNDFIAFINDFFNMDPLADIGRAGGVLGDDGVWDNNDFIAFINAFFAGC